MSILSHCDRRVNRRTVKQTIRRALAEFRAVREQARAYDGGLPLEKRSRKHLLASAVAAARKTARMIYVSRIGRRIDLAALLNERRPDGYPLWTVVDPAYRDTYYQGEEGRRSSSAVKVGGSYRSISGLRNQETTVEPGGHVPALPRQARRLLTDSRIRRRAAWVGLLYQPQEWREVRPDPAVVVEWKDLPGEYYALAVWGHDGPRIMEFVD